MKILIVGLSKNPQLERLKEEGEKREHQVTGCYSSELVINAGPDEFRPHLRGKSMEGFDVIYLWAVGKRRWEWYAAALYLNREFKTSVVNKKIVEPDYNYFLSPASDYLKQVDAQINFPKSALVFSSKSIDSVIDQFSFPLILKTSSGRQGRGVFKIGNKDDLVKKVKKLQKDKKALIIREFIPNDGDIRIFTVGYSAIGAMKRTPPEGDFRSNISQGGSGSEFDLKNNSEIGDIAEELSRVTRTEIAGVDIMIHKETRKPYVLEINPGPQFTGLEKYTNTNAAEEIIKYFEVLRE